MIFVLLRRKIIFVLERFLIGFSWILASFLVDFQRISDQQEQQVQVKNETSKETNKN